MFFCSNKRNFPSIIFFSLQDGVKIATRLFVLNYLLQKRQGEDYQKRENDLECHIESRESRILGSKVPLYISSFALTAVYFTERNSARYNFYGKTYRLRYSRHNVAIINEIFALDILTLILSLLSNVICVWNSYARLLHQYTVNIQVLIYKRDSILNFDSKYLVSKDQQISLRHIYRNCTVKNWSKL